MPTGPATIAQWNRAMRKVLAMPDVREKLGRVGYDLLPGASTEEVVQYTDALAARWLPVIKASGYRRLKSRVRRASRRQQASLPFFQGWNTSPLGTPRGLPIASARVRHLQRRLAGDCAVDAGNPQGFADSILTGDTVPHPSYGQLHIFHDTPTTTWLMAADT